MMEATTERKQHIKQLYQVRSELLHKVRSEAKLDREASFRARE